MPRTRDRARAAPCHRRGHGRGVRRRSPLHVLAPAHRGAPGRVRARREGRAVPQPARFRIVPPVPGVRVRPGVRVVRRVAHVPRSRERGCSATTAARSAGSCRCPRCDSPYLRQFGAGTQRVEAELAQLLDGFPVVRMDADTTRGKGGHERALAEFEALAFGSAAGNSDDRQGARLPGGHPRRRHQRRHHAPPAGLPRRRAHLPASRAGRRSRG